MAARAAMDSASIASIVVVPSLAVAHAELPLTREQRAHPVRHPRHISGGLMVHMTGMMGFVHAYYVLDLRHADGWIGYGGKIDRAKFLALGTMESPLVLDCTCTRVRRGNKQIFARYEFVFTQEQGGQTVKLYESQQAAMWMKVADAEGEAAQ